MTYEFVKNTPVDRDKIRERLQGMSNKELREFGNACERMCGRKPNLEKPPRENLAIELEEARAEWKRRMTRPKDGG